ncbi:MAG: hypothetical protein ABH883_05810, partial [Candidatus Omnitrophota bacterium]
GINYEYFFREAGYTLVVPSILFGAKSKEYGEEKKKYAGIFSLGSYDGTIVGEKGEPRVGAGERGLTLKGLEDFLEKTAITEKTAVILPDMDMDSVTRERLDGKLRELIEKYPLIKFIRIDTNGMDREITGYERRLYRKDLYAMMLLTMRLGERSGAVYEALSVLLETRFPAGGDTSPASEAEAFINLLLSSSPEERCGILVKTLSFVPAGKYILPVYRDLARVIMSA